MRKVDQDATVASNRIPSRSRTSSVRKVDKVQRSHLVNRHKEDDKQKLRGGGTEMELGTTIGNQQQQDRVPTKTPQPAGHSNYYSCFMPNHYNFNSAANNLRRQTRPPHQVKDRFSERCHDIINHYDVKPKMSPMERCRRWLESIPDEQDRSEDSSHPTSSSSSSDDDEDDETRHKGEAGSSPPQMSQRTQHQNEEEEEMENKKQCKRCDLVYLDQLRKPKQHMSRRQQQNGSKLYAPKHRSGHFLTKRTKGRRIVWSVMKAVKKLEEEDNASLPLIIRCVNQLQPKPINPQKVEEAVKWLMRKKILSAHKINQVEHYKLKHWSGRKRGGEEAETGSGAEAEVAGGRRAEVRRKRSCHGNNKMKVVLKRRK